MQNVNPEKGVDLLFFRKFILSVLFLILYLSQNIQSQDKNVDFTKTNYPNHLKELKEAQKSIDEGDRYYFLAEKLHFFAIDFYLKAQTFNPNNAELNMKIGICYLHSLDRLKALEYLEKAIALNKNVDPDIHYYYAQALHLHMEWDKAIAEYNVHKVKMDKSDIEAVRALDKKIEECNNGKSLMKETPLKVKIENLQEINSRYIEYGPIVSADESMMIFTGRLENTTGGMRDLKTSQFYEDIYSTYAYNGVFETPKNLGPPINTVGHDGAIGLSVDGQTLFLYVDEGGNGNIYRSRLKGSEWGKPERLEKVINSEYHESSAAFSPDEKTIYFVSDNPTGSKGGRDIFSSKLDETGKWGTPVNLGSTVNTPYNEEGVYMHPDGKTLFFGSQGHNSMGGYDIFMSVYDETKKMWAPAENLGTPLNTADDDIFMVLSADGKRGYYSSVRPEGKGEKDIYRITFLEDIFKKTVALFTGKVVDEVGKAVGSKIVVKDKSTGEIFGTFESNSSTGKYVISLPKGKVYDIEVTSGDLVPYTETLDIAYKPGYEEINKTIVLKGKKAFIVGVMTDDNGNPLTGQMEIRDSNNNLIGRFESNEKGEFKASVPPGKDYVVVFSKPGYLFKSMNISIPDSIGHIADMGNVSLQKVDIGKKMALNNIFFESGKASLSPESTPELDRAVQLMNDMVSLVIEISGHTDNVGSAGFNQRLSEARARSVVEFMVNRGIDKKRLNYKGYGLAQPVATNDTEEGRQMNRRTEFKVVSVDIKAEEIAQSKKMKERIERGEGIQAPDVPEQSNNKSIPSQFLPFDTNGDGKISSNETVSAIDTFFDGSTDLKVDDILALIDFFFE